VFCLRFRSCGGIGSPFRQAHPFDRLRMTLSGVEWVKARAGRGAGARRYEERTPQLRNLLGLHMAEIEKQTVVHRWSHRCNRDVRRIAGRPEQEPGQRAPALPAGSPRDALRQIAASVAFGTELTLFDSGMKEHELEALGYRSDQINQFQTVSAGDTANLPMLKALAGGQSSARLGLFTSGSTGLPKLVWQTVANLARAVKVSPRHAGAVWSFAYNPTHVAGIQVYLQALANGCPVVDVFGLDRSGVLRAIEDYGVTHVSATPSFYRLLLPAERPLAVVRSVNPRWRKL